MFLNYSKFHRSLILQLLPNILLGLLDKKIRGIIRNQLRGTILKSAVKDYDCHLGMIVRKETFSPFSVLSLKENVSEALDFIIEKDRRDIWSSANYKNKASINFLKNISFDEVGTNRNVVTLVKSL